jgi:hypothetical protein
LKIESRIDFSHRFRCALLQCVVHAASSILADHVETVGNPGVRTHWQLRGGPKEGLEGFTRTRGCTPCLAIHVGLPVGSARPRAGVAASSHAYRRSPGRPRAKAPEVFRKSVVLAPLARSRLVRVRRASRARRASPPLHCTPLPFSDAPTP